MSFAAPMQSVPTGTPVFIDTVESCAELTAKILLLEETSGGTAGVAVDCEGVNLGREGELCILTIATRERVYLIDTHVLGREAFTTGELGHAILENPRITKYFFDCRQDADALYFHFGVALQNVVDLQYSACQLFPPRNRAYLMGLKKTLERLNCAAPEEEKIKDAGLKHFAPEKGGSYENWKKRPLDDVLIQYSAIDVKYFFVLAVRGRLYEAKAKRVGDMRVKKAQQDDFRRSTDGYADWRGVI